MKEHFTCNLITSTPIDNLIIFEYLILTFVLEISEDSNTQHPNEDVNDRGTAPSWRRGVLVWRLGIGSQGQVQTEG